MNGCICSSPGACVQCIACYPNLGRKYNEAEPTRVTPPAMTEEAP